VPGPIDGMSLLDAHGQYSIDDRLGSVVPASFRVDRGKALCRVKFSRAPKADQLFQDILDGHTIPVSVGYRILETQKTEGQGDTLPIVTATKWMPLEVSLVPVPADGNAHTRSEETTDMPTTTTQQTQQVRPDTVAERTRIKTLRDLARTANLPDEDLDQAIDSGTSVDAFRNHVFEKLVERQNQSPTFPMVETRGVVSGHDTIRAAMADALMVRIDRSHKPKNDAREFVGLSLPELARRSLEAIGISTGGMMPGEIVQRALHTTSDFSQVITTVGQAVLGQAYAAVPTSLRAVARQTTARDFKTKTTARLSGFSDLEKVNEHGEYKRGTFAEGAEGYRIKTFGKVFGMTRQMLINDELGAFADVSRELGLAAGRLEADLLASLVNSNPVMSDGKAVFHADHKNLAGTGANLDELTLSAARLAMAKQTGLAGELIDVIPAFLVVPPELQTLAEKLLATIQPTTTSEVNPFAGKLQLVVDRRLTDKPWYVVASPAMVPSLEYAYLEGAEGPQFFTTEGFDIDGVETKVTLDFGAGWVDHRGWYKNAGQ
jgi:hypothetical protein